MPTPSLTTLFGTIPDPRTNAFLRYVRKSVIPYVRGLVPSSRSHAKTFYFAANGSDSNTGTSTASPFLTTSRAAAIMGGTYFAVSGSGNVLTLNGHGIPTGTKFRLGGSAVFPFFDGVAYTPYFYLRSTGTNTLTVHPTYADAVAGTNQTTWSGAVNGYLLLANVCCRFRRGDTFKGQSQILVSEDNCTVNAWYDASTGNLANPILSGFTLPYSSGWTLANANRYTRAETTQVGWLRRTLNPFGLILARATSSANCEATANSWYWAANVLHVNLGGTNPNSLALEAAPDNANPVLFAAHLDPAPAGSFADGALFEGLEVHGFGLSDAQGYAIKVQNSRDANGQLCVAVVRRCGVYWGGYHLFGHNEGLNGALGGFCLNDSCYGGLSHHGTTGAFSISHNGSGGQEAVYLYPRGEYGALPDLSWYDANTAPRQGSLLYGHTGGGGATIGYMLAVGPEMVDNVYGFSGGSGWGDLPGTNGVPTTYRAWTIGERMVGNQPVAPLGIGVGRQVWINCDYEVNQISGTQMAAASSYGLVVNTRLRLRGKQILYNNNAGGPHSPTWVHCSIEVRQGDSNYLCLPGSGQQDGSVAGPQFLNCVIAMDTANSVSATTKLGLYNNARDLNGNAWIGVVQLSGADGFDQDPARVLLGSIPSQAPPGTDSPLYQAGAVLAVPVEYDRTGNKRSLLTPSIGPDEDAPTIIRHIGRRN